MNSLTDLCLVLLILPGFVFLGSGRIRFGIGMLAFQGLLLGVLPFVSSFGSLTVREIIISVINIIVKGIVLPQLLKTAMEKTRTLREEKPFVPFSLSVFFGILCLVISYWLTSRLPGITATEDNLSVMVAFFNIFIGLFIIMSRRQPLSQVLGYLILENGVYIFGISLAFETPFLVELGILLDVFVAVFVMGIVIFHISKIDDAHAERTR